MSVHLRRATDKKMSPKQFWVLFLFYFCYLLIGATIFYNKEHKLEAERRAVALAERIEINGNFY